MNDQLLALIVASVGALGTPVGIFLKRAINNYIKRIVGLEEILKAETSRADLAERRLSTQEVTVGILNKSHASLEQRFAAQDTAFKAEQEARRMAENNVLELQGSVRRQEKVIETLITSSDTKDEQIGSMKQMIDELVKKVNDLTAAKDQAFERALIAESKVAVLMDLQRERVSPPQQSGESDVDSMAKVTDHD